MQRTYDLGDGVRCLMDYDGGYVIWWLTALFYWPSGYSEWVASEEFLAESWADALAAARSYRAAWLAEMVDAGYLLMPAPSN